MSNQKEINIYIDDYTVPSNKHIEQELKEIYTLNMESFTNSVIDSLLLETATCKYSTPTLTPTPTPTPIYIIKIYSNNKNKINRINNNQNKLNTKNKIINTKNKQNPYKSKKIFHKLLRLRKSTLFKTVLDSYKNTLILC